MSIIKVWGRYLIIHMPPDNEWGRFPFPRAAYWINVQEKLYCNNFRRMVSVFCWHVENLTEWSKYRTLVKNRFCILGERFRFCINEGKERKGKQSVCIVECPDQNCALAKWGGWNHSSINMRKKLTMWWWYNLKLKGKVVWKGRRTFWLMDYICALIKGKK